MLKTFWNRGPRRGRPPGRRLRALRPSLIEALEERITPDSTLWAGTVGFIQGGLNGLYNMGAGVV